MDSHSDSHCFAAVSRLIRADFRADSKSEPIRFCTLPSHALASAAFFSRDGTRPDDTWRRRALIPAPPLYSG
eukprot:656618-Prymnesium_polylepis.1